MTGDHTNISPCYTSDSVGGGSLTKVIQFTVFNTANMSDEYEMTCETVAPVVSCGVSHGLKIIAASDSGTVNVTATISGANGIGRVTLKARSTVNLDSATGTVRLTGTRAAPTVSVAPHNGEFIAPASCVAQCFAATASFTTPAYISRDVPRSVTLLYSSLRAKPRGLVQVDVNEQSGSAPSTVSIRLKRGSSWVTFSDGTTEAFYPGSRGTSRLAAQFDAPDWVSLLTDTVYIRSTWTSPNETKEVKAVVRTPTSKLPYYYGAGWWLDGLQYANYFTGAIVVTEPTGSLIVFDSISAAGNKVTYASNVDLSRIERTGDWNAVIRQYPDSTKVQFDNNGRMQFAEDRFGNRTTYHYSNIFGEMLVDTIVDPAGKKISLTYNGAKRLTSITDPAGRSIFLGHDAQGDYPLTNVWGPDYDGTNGATTRLAQYQYSASTGALMTRRLDARGQEWVYAYDVVGTLAADTAPKILVGVDSVRPVTRFSSPTLLVLRGGSGSGTSTAPYGRVSSDTIGGVVTDPEGHVTRFRVDRFGQPTRITDALGRVTTITYDKLRPSVVTAPNLSQEAFTYTGAYLTSSWKTGDQTINYSYSDSGQLKQVSGIGRPTTNYFYDSFGRDSVVKAGSNPTRTTKYAWGTSSDKWQLLSVTDPENHVTRYHYDGVTGNADSTITPGNRITTRVFDTFGRDSAVRVTSLPTQWTVYDRLNQVLKIRTGGSSSGSGALDSTSFQYDAGGLLRRVTDAKGQLFRFEYNNLGWKSAELDPVDSMKKITRRYDRDGQLTSWTNRRLDTLNFTYDSLHRLLSKTGRNTRPAHYRYDLLGKLFVDSNAVVKNSAYLRDNGWTDSIVTEIASRKFRRRYVPDIVMRLDSMTVMDIDTVSSRLRFTPRRYFYGATTGTVDSIRVGNAVVRLTHNNDGLRTYTMTPARWSRRERYTSLHTKVEEEIERLSPGGEPVSLTWLGVGTDTLGRVTRLWRDSLNTKVTKYVFDSLGRLAREDTFSLASPVVADSVYGYNRDSTGNPMMKRAYAWDGVGNERAGGGSDTTRYDSGNRMLHYPGLDFGVDADGNRIWKKSTVAGNDTVRYHWSAENLLDSVRVGARTVRYAYDAAGQLIRKEVNGSPQRHFLWDQGHLLAELNGAATNRIGEYAYYFGTDQPLALMTGDTTVMKTRYYQQDMLGNVTAVLGPTTAGDSVNQTLTYEAFGKLEGLTGSLADTNRLRWKALLWEGDSTQLYYVRNRWYDAGTHRFVTEDPIGIAGGTNLYAFGANDPVNRSDPTGTDFVDNTGQGRCFDVFGNLQNCDASQVNQGTFVGVDDWGQALYRDSRGNSSYSLPRGNSGSSSAQAGSVVGYASLVVLRGAPKQATFITDAVFLGQVAELQGTAKRLTYFGAVAGFEELAIYYIKFAVVSAGGTSQYHGLAQVEGADGSFIYWVRPWVPPAAPR